MMTTVRTSKCARSAVYRKLSFTLLTHNGTMTFYSCKLTWKRQPPPLHSYKADAYLTLSVRLKRDVHKQHHRGVERHFRVERLEQQLRRSHRAPRLAAARRSPDAAPDKLLPVATMQNAAAAAACSLERRLRPRRRPLPRSRARRRCNAAAAVGRLRSAATAKHAARARFLVRAALRNDGDARHSRAARACRQRRRTTAAFTDAAALLRRRIAPLTMPTSGMGRRVPKWASSVGSRDAAPAAARPRQLQRCSCSRRGHARARAPKTRNKTRAHSAAARVLHTDAHANNLRLRQQLHADVVAAAAAALTLERTPPSPPPPHAAK